MRLAHDEEDAVSASGVEVFMVGLIHFRVSRCGRPALPLFFFLHSVETRSPARLRACLLRGPGGTILIWTRRFGRSLSLNPRQQFFTPALCAPRSPREGIFSAGAFTPSAAWREGARYLMNQFTFGQMLTMSDATGRPIMG